MTRRCWWPILAGLVSVLPTLGCLNNLPRTSSLELPRLANNSPDRPAPELPARKSAQVCFRMAATMEKNGHDAEAVVEYERSRQYDPRVHEVARRLAVLYDRLGMHQRALEEFQRALQESPKDVDLINDLGFSYYNRGQWAEAEKHFRDVLARNPKHPTAWNNLGLTLGQQGRYPEAMEAFQHVVTLAEAHSNLAFVLSTQGKREEAKQEYRLALALEPDLRICQLALAKLEKTATLVVPPDPLALAQAAVDAVPWRAEVAKQASPVQQLPEKPPDITAVVVDMPKSPGPLSQTPADPMAEKVELPRLPAPESVPTDGTGLK